MAEAPENGAEQTEQQQQEQGTEQTVPYERFRQANAQAKEAKAAAKAATEQLTAMQRQLEEMQEQQTAGLPELEQLKRRLEATERRAEERDKAASEAQTALANTRKERWLMAAASAQNFADPADASAFVNLDEIEDEKDAERAIKGLAKSKKYLLRSEERQLPGKLMEDGKPVGQQQGKAAEMEPMVAALQQGLRQFASPEALADAGLK